MNYSVEHLVICFLAGLVVGVISTVFFTKRKLLEMEQIISLLIVTLWLTLHTYGFFSGKEVPWLMDFAGFGAAGNFIGINVKDIISGRKLIK